MAAPSSRGIRRLGPDDWASFRELRLTALKREPANFGSSWEDEVEQPDSFWRDWTERSTILGAFAADGALVGLAGIYVQPGRTVRHKAHLFTMYVAEAGRGQGLGRRLCEAAIAAARELPGVTQLMATVWADNAPAFALYRSLGFVQWGLEPRGTRTADGTWCDDAQLVLRFE
ncbi:Ribosomal protein S18 acetylase RimI [Tistlia consotensis]|uniref:Ribosomal protein S18 acetylase RimI n=1 Tax=Tistlia consotensis USBA 355 TaxID=560819 RepID=A0A1Y6CEC6_9PROT|nr:N-acetyltransferase [Tistlia consotensis]SMF48157.1 Ribosomal protein S18 acetylase RimI [Tistlia consotensis USBA 355]SNR81761.1 Ribosomal protein S18 acetylase RimI [Tistlia consotensis]